MKHYEDLIDRLRTATKLPLLQALMNEAADEIEALAADRRCAVPVSPHGRLIDADALEKDIDKYTGGEESRSRFHHLVQVQSVVIPGNKGEQT